VSSLFASGWIVDLILAGLVLEAIALLLFRAKTGRGIPAVGLLTNLLAGACLLMALRSSLVGQAWYATATWLAIALFAHVADLAQRWLKSEN
jgi:hypothetical protein